MLFNAIYVIETCRMIPTGTQVRFLDLNRVFSSFSGCCRGSPPPPSLPPLPPSSVLEFLGDRGRGHVSVSQD